MIGKLVFRHAILTKEDAVDDAFERIFWSVEMLRDFGCTEDEIASLLISFVEPASTLPQDGPNDLFAYAGTADGQPKIEAS
jgi:hypothetical protein